MADRLEAPDRSVELDAPLRVLDGHLEQHFGESQAFPTLQDERDLQGALDIGVRHNGHGRRQEVTRNRHGSSFGIRIKVMQMGPYRLGRAR